ncbi:hypothetical protein K5549_016336, partial [Capra hircus]
APSPGRGPSHCNAGRGRRRTRGSLSRSSPSAAGGAVRRVPEERERGPAGRPLIPVHTHPTRPARSGRFRKLADFRLFLPPRHFEGISAAFMDRLGHQLEDMLLSCKYRGELCGPHNFSSIHSTPRSYSVSGVKGWEDREACLKCGLVLFGKLNRNLFKYQQESAYDSRVPKHFQFGRLWRKPPEYQRRMKL